MARPDVDPLLTRLASGDHRAFEIVYKQYAARLYATALRLVDRREDAEDAVQQVFAGLVRTRATLPQVEDLAAYLFASLRRAAQKAAARTARQPLAAMDLVANTAAEAMADASELADQQRLQQCLSALPKEQREVVALKLTGRLTFAQIAHVLGVNPNTAASRYRLALQKLRDALEASVR